MLVLDFKNFKRLRPIYNTKPKFFPFIFEPNTGCKCGGVFYAVWKREQDMEKKVKAIFHFFAAELFDLFYFPISRCVKCLPGIKKNNRMKVNILK